MFWDCKYVAKFWKLFADKFDDKIGSHVNMTNVFIGTENSLFCSVVFNAKRYIYKCFMLNSQPNFLVFTRKLQYICNIEKQIMHNKMDKWRKKWQAISDDIL